jgi:GR25 family glycosyltransferase involved in LPS biosynthesis
MKERNFIKNILNTYNVKIFDIKNNGNILNEYTEKIYVINLKDNSIRRRYISTIMKKYGISYKLVIVKKIDNDIFEYYDKKYNNNISCGELGCGLSHLWCLNDIVKNKYKNAIIFEDDIIFHKNMEAKFYNIITQQKYDFLLLGACDFHFSKINYKNVINNLYHPNNINNDKLYGAHANYYSYEGACYMLKYKLKKFAFFDYGYNKIFSHFESTSFICYPNLVVTDLSTSNLNHSYDFFSKSEKIFYSKCFKNFNFNEYNFIYLNILKDNNINSFKNYKKYIYSIIDNHFKNDESKSNIIKNRIDVIFFDLKDIKQILNVID